MAKHLSGNNALDADRRLRDVVALSTLPAIWTGAEPQRIAESLAAALFTTLRPAFIYVSFADDAGQPTIAVAQTDRYETDPKLAEQIGPAVLDWAKSKDPDQLLVLPNPLGPGHVHVSARPLGLHAELGVIAVGFLDGAAPTSFDHLVLNVGATQAATAINNARLLRSVREAETHIQAAKAELDRRFAELQQANIDLENSRRSALHLMEDAVQSRQLAERLNSELRKEVDERKQKEEALRLRTSQYETLLNQAPIGVCVVDADFRIQEANPVARLAWGEIPDAGIGRNFEEVVRAFWDETLVDEILRVFRKTLETGEAYVVPEMAVRAGRQGTEFYAWRVDRISLRNGQHGLVCYFRDISDQVQARLKIAESEERFRAFVTTSSDVVYRMSPDWSEMRHLDGRDSMAHTHEPDRDWLDKYIYPEDKARVLEAIAEAVETKGIFELEHRVLRIDGTLAWTFSRAVPILDADGVVIEWFGSARDVSRRKLAEEAALASQAEAERQRRLYETILSNTPDLAYVFDLDHRFIYANDGLLKLWGRTREEAIGKNCTELGYEPWHAAMHDREIDEVIATKRPIRGEVPFTGSFGHRIYDYIFVPVFDSDGEVVAVAGTTRDVTDRKQAEEAIRKQAEQLREADRRKDQFLATLAHELRNPLAPISNALQIWPLVENDPREAERVREMMGRQVRQMIRLIDDLLDVSRITRGKIELRKERIDLAYPIEGALEGVRPFVESCGHQLTVALPKEPISLEGDVGRLMQVFGNLVHNAAKYTGRNGHIWVTASREGDRAVVSVRDNGPGIPPEMLIQVFELFTQVDQTLDRAHGGLGIGLTLVKTLVELHGGTVEAFSQGTGQGSEFVVRLPVEAAASNQSPSSPAHHRPAALPTLRVLVVDDVKPSANTLAMMLRGLGQETQTVYDGPAALAAAQSFQPDAAFLDIAMPGMDGYEVAKRLRELDGRRPVLVALTGYGQEEDRQKAFEAGFDHHLVKPASVDALYGLLMTVPEGTPEVKNSALTTKRLASSDDSLEH